MSVLLSFPFSSAAVERLFSQLSLIRSKHWAFLKQESLLALLQAKTYFNNRGLGQAGKYESIEEMISLHKKNISYVTYSTLEKLRKNFLKVYNNNGCLQLITNSLLFSFSYKSYFVSVKIFY